jgi:hypothetical protein
MQRIQTDADTTARAQHRDDLEVTVAAPAQRPN